MECAGNGRARLDPRPVSQPWLLEAVGTGRWRGARLRDLLDRAGVGGDAVEVLFTGLDRGIENDEEQLFQRSLTLADALGEDVLLAYELNGAPLPPQHGFPLRLLVPGWYGMTNVKWLARITVLDGPSTATSRRAVIASAATRTIRDAADTDAPACPDGPAGYPGVHVARADARRRSLRGRRPRVVGKAPISAVDVSTDGGESWSPATLDVQELGPWAWRRWSFDWDAAPGQYVLCCRARDEAGNEQPVGASWNVGGYANNEVQRVVVRVRQ